MWRFLLLLYIPLMVLSYPRFDPTATMQNVLVPADAAVSSVIYRLRATDTSFDFPLDFVLEGDSTIVSLETLNCSRFNSVCQANVILQKKLEPDRFYDFIVALRNPRGMTVRMRCSFRATNATTPIADIFPGAPSLIQVSESAKRNTELGVVIARGNPAREKAAFIELWGSSLFGLRQRLINEKDAEAAIILIGSLDYETQRSHHITVLANDAWTESGNDSRNIAAWPLLIAVLDEQDTPPVFTLAPPVTVLDPNIKPGDYILTVHAEDGDRGNPRAIRYGLVSEGNPFTSFFNLSDDKGILRLAKPVSEIQAISHVGAPVILTVVAEEIRIGADEPPALSTSVQIALLPPVPTGNSVRFSSRLFTTDLDENSPPGTMLKLPDAEVIGEPGELFGLELINNNGTFDISPGVVKGKGKFLITVRDSRLLDYEVRHTVQCVILAKQLGSENNTISAPLIVTLNDVNDIPPRFNQMKWHSSILESAEIGTSVLTVEAIDPDTKSESHIRYTRLLGPNNTFFLLNPVSGLITVAEILDAESISKFELTVEATDDYGKGLSANASVIIEIIDVNDEPPKFEKKFYEFILHKSKKKFTFPAFIKAVDSDLMPPNNVVHYELITPAENLTLDKNTGELRVKSIWNHNEMLIIKARAWDEGVPRLSGECEIRIYPPGSRTGVITFVVPGLEHDPTEIENTLQKLTKSKVMIEEIRPYKDKNNEEPSRSQVVATIIYGPDTVIDIETIEEAFRLQNREREEIVMAGGIPWPWWLLIMFVIILVIIIIILICCCICAPCPLYIAPRKRRTGSAEASKLIVRGSGHGFSSKSVQVAEWFGRREAWTPDGAIVENEAESLRRHEFERGSALGGGKHVVNKTHFIKDDPREQLYIREGNTDILRLITRGGEHQRPNTLVEQSVVDDNGKEILMRRFIDQQQMTSRAPQASLPNEITHNQTEHDQLEATLREQNNLLKQILLEREREVRLETQSLPAGTQTDRDAFTQTEPRYLRPPRRLIRSDNDASDASEDESYVTKNKRTSTYSTVRKKDGPPFKRKIRTPIQEESESNVETSELQEASSSTRGNLDRLRLQVIKELLNERSSKNRPTRSAIRKEVLKEIAASLMNSDDNGSDHEYDRSASRTNLYRHLSDDSFDKTSYVREEGNKQSSQEPQRYHSENDLQQLTDMENLHKTRPIKSVSQFDITKRSKTRANRKKIENLKPRYMEWYEKMQQSNNAKQLEKEKPGTSGVSSRQVAMEAKNQKKLNASSSETSSQISSKKGQAHRLTQHSANRFEPPPSSTRREDDADSGIALVRPPMAEKKSVFSIAYEDIQRQTRQLRPESGTPPT
ncbi:hypothetical protein RI129_001831 [Pyrocoelia pectoralis]|uniref:Cadherin domain-containing protein n=1 Tax=Pyrocoelia pectoralis TaxID=417401 RepID=A0AAN7VLB8_9COLE